MSPSILIIAVAVVVVGVIVTALTLVARAGKR